MREFKFRAWDKEQNKMLYGDDVVIAYNDICFEDEAEEDCEKVKGMNLWVKENIDTASIHDAVFMQYAGYKDKNKEEIYGKDIIKGVFEFEYEVEKDTLKIVKKEITGEVVFKMGSFGILFDGDCFIPLMNAISSTLEKLGNVFENPELLKGIK